MDLSSTLVQAQESVEQVVDLTVANELLEASKTSLESDVSGLETEIEELSNQGIPGFSGPSVLLGLLMSVVAVFYLSKRKQMI